MSRNILHIEESYDDIFMIGISSSMKDYKISFELNKKFHLQLSKTDNFIVEGNEFEQNDSFSFFKDEKNLPEKIYLIMNKGGRRFLFEEIKKIDYIFIIINPEKDAHFWISQMRDVKGVSGVFHIQPEVLKNKFVLQYFN